MDVPSVFFIKNTEKDKGNITKKAPLQSFGIRDALFYPMVTGLKENKVVNMNTNHLFTAQFDENSPNTYKKIVTLHVRRFVAGPPRFFQKTRRIRFKFFRT